MTARTAAQGCDLETLLRVVAAFRDGDFSARLPADWTGLEGKLADALNDAIATNQRISQELLRLREVVGKQGRSNERISAGGARGGWADSIHAVNDLVEDLIRPNSEIAQVIEAVAHGDLTRQVPMEVDGSPLQGQFARSARTVNTMVGQLSSFASEVTRVAHEVGTEGKLGGQATVKGMGGVWKDLSDSVNTMAGNLTAQVRNIAEVTTAVANGDLSKKITVEGRGEILELKNTINAMVDQLNAFASEVTRVAREVGTEGKLGGQATVRGVGGVWADLTGNVNQLAGQLTSQIRNIAEVTTAVANGDLSKKVTVDVQGEILELKSTINVMVDQLNAFASEVTRVAREVGTEGQLGVQATVRGVSGTWADLTDSVNLLAGQLTSQIRNIADVTTAVANGDLSKKVTVESRGEILELKNTINVMVDQLNAFASEVTRVAREVGTEGKLAGQAQVRGVSGTWADLTDNVNLMAANLTAQVRNIAEVTTAVANGDLSKKITVEGRGEILELKNTINAMVDQLNAFASEVTRVAREVGTEGKLGGQATVRGVGGVWADLTDNVNQLADQLTSQIRNIAEVTTAVANGDLSKKVTVDVQGEILELKSTINVMVDQLNAFAGEVTRVAREVGTEGKLGGQADVRGVSGTWKDLTDNVNSMAANLTEQVRGIARVVTAVANGDLKRKLAVEAKGEVAALAETINEMTDTLATFADQVTTVAREVGVQGRLGGQARVPGAAGTWRDLTDNVNQLAATLTDQIRAIADVSTAVTEGDLTRSIGVAASGEVAVLKDKINVMIRNLRETTQRNTEQDWLKTNLARFTRILQGQRDLNEVSRLILSELAPLVGAGHGIFYTVDRSDAGAPVLRLVAGYAYRERRRLATTFQLGEGLAGQCALEKERILVRSAPADYVTIGSGLGEAPPLSLVALPVLFEGEVRAVIELASFEPFSATHIDFLDQLMESIGIVLNTIEATMRTENLLEQSQSLAGELQSQQEELRSTNEELERKAVQLAEQNAEVERKNAQVEESRRSLQEQAEQLALTSKYKSEFLANMSHELRTPLNSMLILAEQLTDNPAGNLTGRQIEFAQIIRSSGNDLMTLISDVLDLSKIESGTVALEIAPESFTVLQEQVERSFRHVADARGLSFQVVLEPGLPPALWTDSKRLQQVLRNLLANAFKFTQQGGVELRVRPAGAASGRAAAGAEGARAEVAFEVSDTGVGIPPEQQRVIFEAFQQADGTTSRTYGGTGLGLSISRELVRLLGGRIELRSAPGEGSTFTVQLPLRHPGTRPDEAVDGGLPQPSRESPPLEVRPAAALPLPAPREVADDRDRLEGGAPVVLIVEDDPNFARVLLDLAHESGFRGVVALSGDAALELARRHPPAAVTLDIGLRDVSGWQVLDALGGDPATAGVPVHLITVFEDARSTAAQRGAASFLAKPASREALSALFAGIGGAARRAPTLLVVEDDEAQRREVVEAARARGFTVREAGSGEEALEELRQEGAGGVVLDLRLPDISGFELLKRARREPGLRELPVFVYTALELGSRERAALRRQRAPVVAKAGPDSCQELMAVIAKSFPVPEPALPAGEARRPAVAGHRALVVDDDVRNVFALSALLEQWGMEVTVAESGDEALAALRRDPGIEMALIDVMMPDKDGYQTMREIRGTPAGARVPLIAVTAKAMAGDRERCLDAGATDYISKPIDSRRLLDLISQAVEAEPSAAR